MRREIGFPVILKAAAGGGGRGMKIVREPRRAGAGVLHRVGRGGGRFGNGDMYIERYVEKPRHIEIQIVADEHGNVIHLGERECSVQRRHQKLIEESPSPALTPELREEMGRVSVKAMEKTPLQQPRHHRVPDGRDAASFYFMEMNTRIQVEHPVTEHGHRRRPGARADPPGLRASRCGFKQEDVQMRGAAIECRVNAEDPVTFAPWPGKITAYSAPGGLGVRVDSAAYENYTVLPHYDSLLAKLIVFAEDRPTAIRRMQRALGEYVVQGIRTNIPFHRAALAEDAFLRGEYDTRFVERLLASETGAAG